MNSVAFGNIIESSNLSDISSPLLCHMSNLVGTLNPTICKHVITFATKVPKPAVGDCCTVILSGTIYLQTCASWLFLFWVNIAINRHFLI
jgi:hypothetical protein